MALTLYSAWRATAPYRVRIGLALKGLSYDYVAVDLAASEQHKAPYRAINPQRLTPSLQVDDQVLVQSLAILEWLEETHPEPALLPKEPLDRAIVRAMSQIIACDIHPLNNLRVARALSAMKVSEQNRQTWIERWIIDGFQALEPLVRDHGGEWAFGDSPGLVDCCLIPQIYSANRYSVDLSAFPALCAIGRQAEQHPAFQAAHPQQQPDSVQLNLP